MTIGLTDDVVVSRQLGDPRWWKSGWSLSSVSPFRTVFTALTNDSSQITRIVELDVTRDSVVRSIDIHDSLTYPWLLLGARTGSLYLASDAGARIRIIRGDSVDVRFSGGRDPTVFRSVYWAKLSSDENRLNLSYHDGASGVDWIELRNGQPAMCKPPIPVGSTSGCVSAHGNVEPFRGGIVAADGARLSVFDSVGHSRGSLNTGLPMNHFMEFTIDSTRSVSFNLISCAFGTGVTAVRLDSARAGPATYLNREVCGERIVRSATSRLLGIVSGNRVTLLDAHSGTVVRRFTLPANIIDLLVLDGDARD